MILRLPLRFEGSKGEKTLYALFDSGATFSCINPEYAAEIGNIERLHTPLDVATASQGVYMRIEDTLRSDFYFEEIRLSDEFMVVPNLSEEAIIGANTM